MINLAEADSKTGARDVVLSGPAIALLAAADRKGSPWVIPGRVHGHHLVNLQIWWTKVLRPAAELGDDVKLHSLRHTSASLGTGAGLSLLMVAGVLGHKQTVTTERYAQVDQDPLHAAANVIGDIIEAHVDVVPEADVVELRK